MSEILIRAENVSKKFCRDLKKSLWYGVKDSSRDLLRLNSGEASRNLRPAEFWANKDINFEVKRGECLGLIGRNGAGKTTLLKLLSGLIKPDEGHVTMRGRVGALIALGAGFNPILTGRENVFVNAAVLGFKRREIIHRFDSIVQFAELEHAIDSPVQTYSSGMNVRLGFAIACQMDADVLLIDEVLAVGDGAFRTKCFKFMMSRLDQFAIVFVSHSMAQIARICTHAAYMKSGRMLKVDSNVPYVIQAYLSDQPDLAGEKIQLTDEFTISRAMVEGISSDSATIVDVRQGRDIHIRLSLQASRPFPRLVLNALIVNQEEMFVAGCRSAELHVGEGCSEVEILVPDIRLAPGKYSVTFGANEFEATSRLPLQLLQHDKLVRFQVVSPREGSYEDTSLTHISSEWVLNSPTVDDPGAAT